MNVKNLREADSIATVVRGGLVVAEDGVHRTDVVIGSAGTVLALVDPDVGISAPNEIDASGNYVFPGGVDTHVHFNDPGLTESEDFYTGTSGAAAGGITTVLEMPQTLPLVDSVARFADKRRIVEQRAVVDFGLYSALVPDNCRNLPVLQAIRDLGAVGFKGFVCDTPEMPRLSEDDLLAGMSGMRSIGLPLAVHSESQAVINAAKSDFVTNHGGIRTAKDVAEARTSEAESEAVAMVLRAASQAGVRLHLVHVSNPRTLDLIDEARKTLRHIGVETCPQYLLLSRDDLETASLWGVCNPPLNTPDNLEKLWDAVRDGRFDNIASDHCAYTGEQKMTANAWDCGPGITGIEIGLPAIVADAVRRGISLSHVARLMSGNPAREFGLFPKKGSIMPGSDADLTIVSLRHETRAEIENMFTRSAGTAYEGREFGARVMRTMVRGRTVYIADGKRGKILVEPGFGEFLRPKHPWSTTKP